MQQSKITNVPTIRPRVRLANGLTRMAPCGRFVDFMELAPRKTAVFVIHPPVVSESGSP